MLPHKTGIWRPKLRFFLAVSAFMALCFIASAFTAEGAPVAPNAVSEQQLTQQLRFYTPIQELKAEFTQTKHLKEMGLDLKSEGNLHFSRPSDVDWEITQPARIMVKIRADAITVESGSGKDMTTQTLKLGDVAGDQATKGLALLLPWLKLDAKALAQAYEITESDYKSRSQSFHFVPRGGDSAFKSMDMELAPDGHLTKMTMAEASGDQLEILFKKPQIIRQNRSGK